ncbi:MAG: hypothetical protein HOH04_12825 [Rhodospirillaceae bacterium]|nr:hypothetical protein [Rhodospirillaceae bacterium]
MKFDSLRVRLSAFVLVVTALLSALAVFVVHDAYDSRRIAELNQLRNQLTQHVSRAASRLAIERGVGNTILGGNKELLSAFNEVSQQGDESAAEIERVIGEIEAAGFANADFNREVTDWHRSSEVLKQSRRRLAQGKIESKEWLDVTTANIFNAFDLRDLIFRPETEDEAIPYFNMLLRTNIAASAEYAGRERALVGNTLAQGWVIPSLTKDELQQYRSRVDQAVRQILLMKEQSAIQSDLIVSIRNFEEKFLTQYDRLRRRVFAASAETSRVVTETKRSLAGLQRDILNDLHGIENDLAGIAADLNLRAQIRKTVSGNPVDFSRVIALFEDLNVLHERYAQIRYLDETGQERVRLDVIDGQSVMATPDQLQDKSARYYFTEAIKLPVGGVHVSRLDLNVEFGRIVRPFQPMLRYSSPVYVDGEKRGAVVLNVLAENFIDRLADDILLVDQDGFYLRHPNDAMEWGMMEALKRQSANIKADIPDAADRILSGQSAEIIIGNIGLIAQPVHYHPSDPSRFWVMIKEIKPPAYPTDSTEWIEQATIAINSAVGVSETMGAISDQISARQIQSVRGAIIVASGLGIVVIITLLLFFRDLTRAGRMLGRITSELESLSAGDLARRITFRRASVTSNEAVSGDNEMDAIAMGVNRMADNLEKSMTSLRSARDDLETRVAERTQEVLSAKEMAENADQAKSDFLAHMSHELRTPLNAVLGFADAIRHEISGPVGNATYKGYIEDIHTSAGHLLNLINDILDLSKIEAREMVVESEEVELGDLLSECTNLIAMQAEAAGLLIRIDEPTTPVTLYVDRRALKQIVLNLLSNAIKFSDTGREILIKAALEDDGRFGLSVIDQGVGMTPIGIEWAFKPYGQTSNHKTKSHQGTGLGLPLSKGLVEAHGGKLLLESELGHGTTVTIMLPASRVVR